MRLKLGLLPAGITLLLALPSAGAPRPAQPRVHAQPSAKPPAQVDAILDDVVDRLWTRGDWYWHEGRYEERVALDRLVIRMEPRFAEAYGTAGWLLESLGRDQEALALYRQAVAAVPDRWETHEDLGMFHYQHKEYEAAAAAFKQATQQPGAPAYSWKMLAHSYERIGDLERSVAAWEEAGRVAPDDGAVAVNLRRVRARLNGATKE
jgi:tetratricopeptide (TPR) repeat protein